MQTYIKENKFCNIAMNEVKTVSNSSIHRLMALKFVKSLFTLGDRSLIEEIKNNDLYKCVEMIVESMKDNNKKINMLQSATLELVNVFSEQIRNLFGIEVFKVASKDFMISFEHVKNLLP